MRRGAIQAFVLHGVGVCCLLAMHALLARLMGPREYGIVGYVLNLAGILSLVVPLGWPTALLRLIAQYLEEKRWGLFKGAFLQSHRITFYSSVVTGLILFGLSFVCIASPDVVLSLRFCALLLPIVSFVPLRRKALQALQRIPASITFEEILLPILVIILCILLVAEGARQVLWIYFASSSAVLLIASLWLWQAFPADARTVKPEFQTGKWMAVALPLMLGNLSQVLINRAGIILLGAMSDMEAVGLLNAANRLATLNAFVLAAVNTIAAPMLGAAYHGHQFGQFRLLMRKAMIWSVMGSMPLLFLMLIWPEALLRFFGPEFLSASVLLRILAVGQFVNAATGPVGFGLIMAGREAQFGLSTFTLALINILGNFLVIPHYGLTGAAIVSSGSVALLNCWQFLLFRRLLSNSPQRDN